MEPISTFHVADAVAAPLEERKRIAEALGRALEARGCCFLDGTGIPPGTFEGAAAAAGEFFDLPIDVKRRAAPPEVHGLTGYAYGEPRETYGKGTEPPDMWHIGRDVVPKSEAFPGNPWPDADAPAFRPALERLRGELDSLAARFFSLLSLYLFGDETSLVSGALPDGLVMLRMMRYPPHTGEVVDRTDRSEPHADTSIITMATGGSVAGLEVATPEGGYEPIPPGHGHVLIMAGRMLELLTNGYVRGLKHRATWYRDVRGERFAMPYFVGPRVDFQLRPLPRFVERAGEERYESYGVFDFIRAVTAFGDANYSDHEKKDAIVGSSVISDPVSIDFARKRRAPARPQSGA